MGSDTFSSIQRLAEEDRRECLARERNLRDAARLAALKERVEIMRDAIIPLLADLEHPDARGPIARMELRYSPHDTDAALKAELLAINVALMFIRSEIDGRRTLTLDDDNGG